jgi:hypothetical protein
MRAPEYDIARYRQEILAGGVDRLAISQVVYGEPAAEEPGGVDLSLAFNVVVAAVAAALGLVIVLKLRSKP